MKLMDGFPPAKSNRVTLANWRTPPFNRWAFNHVSELVPSALIHGAHVPAVLEPNPADLHDFRVAHAGGTLDMAGWLETTYTDSLVILKDGHLAFEYYAPGQDARTPQGGGRARTSRTGKSPVEGFRHKGARMPASGMMRTGPENGAGRDRSLFAQERAARRHGRSGKHGCACRFGYEYRPASERSRAPRLKCVGIFPLFPQLPPAPACHSALPSSALPVRTFSFTRVSPAQDQTQP